MDGSEWLFIFILTLLTQFAVSITTNKTSEHNSAAARTVYPVTALLHTASPFHGIRHDPLAKIVIERDKCSTRIQSALGLISGRRSPSGHAATFDLSGYALHQPLRSAPYDMYVTDMLVRIPGKPNNWARIDNCRYDPVQSTLQTRLVFRDLAITGAVKLYDEINSLKNPQQAHPAEKCKMTIRLKRAGLGFMVVPRRAKTGSLAVSTSATFLEPHFVSVHAYGCDNPELIDRKAESAEGKEFDIGQEMEDVFLRGIQPLLTTYMEKQLHPALRDTLMVNLGYSVSYGR